MEPEELKETLNLMVDDAAAIIHNQQVLAGIHTELDKNTLFPYEQDYIYQEHFGQLPSEPQRHTINGIDVTSRILHQTGIRLSDVVGADMLYEIENEKFALIQYKRASNDRLKGDRDQLNTLLDNCPDVCIHKRNRPIPQYFLPLKLNGYCGCWYSAIINGTKHYVHACEAETFYDSQSSIPADKFLSGLTEESYTGLFASCRVGAFLRQHPREGDLLPDDYARPLLDLRHIILEIRQLGRWLS